MYFIPLLNGGKYNYFSNLSESISVCIEPWVCVTVVFGLAVP